MEFQYQVFKKTDQILAATGKTVHAALDTAGKPCRLPQRVREVFA
jgi:acyl-CoA thioesterase FadM